MNIHEHTNIHTFICSRLFIGARTDIYLYNHVYIYIVHLYFYLRVREGMNMDTWKSKKEHLENLVKELSDLHGGDEPEWLANYKQDLMKRFHHHLDDAIMCFQNALPKYQRIAYLEAIVKPVGCFSQQLISLPGVVEIKRSYGFYGGW